MKEVLYRYANGTGDMIILEEFQVLTRTRCGKWIDVYGTARFVRNDTLKRYAHETREAALASFLARKHRQHAILRAQLKAVEEVLRRVAGATPDTLVVRSGVVLFDGVER